MKLVAKKSLLNGTVRIPGSKSHTIRAVVIASLAAGQSNIRNPLISSDTMAAVRCYRALGSEIDINDNKLWKVTGSAGQLFAPQGLIDVGNSGTTLRIAMGSASLAGEGEVVGFTGDEQIRSRPVGALLDSLNNLGARAISVNNNGKAPVRISGQLKGGKTTIAAVTSQYLSSLLLCTPLCSGDSRIEVTVLNEPGYVQMTLDWLDKQEIDYENQSFRNFVIRGGQSYKAFDALIPADFSSATFFLCAAALFGEEVTLSGLDFCDSQPDKAVAEYLQAMGADINIGRNSVTVRGGRLKGVEIDMNQTPDALPAMAVTAAFAEGKTRLFNVAQARNKETDRIKCMACELKKMGITVEELADGLIISGGKVRPAQVNGWSDHRIVMALSLAGLGTEDRCVIDTAEAIEVTFPDYVNLMKSIGADMEMTG